MLQNAGLTLSRLNPCPYTDTASYRPRSNYDMACLGLQSGGYRHTNQKPRAAGPVEFTLPQSLPPTQTETTARPVETTRPAEREAIIAEMQEILTRVMSKMEREANYRTLHAEGVFKYEDYNYEEPDDAQEQKKMAFSDLMNMKKTSHNKNIVNTVTLQRPVEFRRNPVRETTSKVVKFGTDEQLRVNPVIGSMMENIDSYEKHFEGKLRGEIEDYFQPLTTVNHLFKPSNPRPYIQHSTSPRNKFQPFENAIVYQNIVTPYK